MTDVVRRWRSTRDWRSQDTAFGVVTLLAAMPVVVLLLGNFGFVPNIAQALPQPLPTTLPTATSTSEPVLAVRNQTRIGTPAGPRESAPLARWTTPPTGSTRHEHLGPWAVTATVTGCKPIAGRVSVTLTWQASDVADSYDLLRADAASANYEVVGSVPDRATTFTDDTADYRRTYSYVVRARKGTQARDSDAARLDTPNELCLRPPSTFIGETRLV